MIKIIFKMLVLGMLLAGTAQNAEAAGKVKEYNLKQLHKTDGVLTDDNGVPVTGLVIDRYASGVMLLKNSYKDGKRHGKQLLFGDNGRVLTEANYNNGRTDGKVKIFYRTGAVLGEIEFNKGRPLSGYCIPTTGIRQELTLQELKDFVLKGGKLPCPQL